MGYESTNSGVTNSRTRGYRRSTDETERVHGKRGETGSSGDDKECGGQESELRPDEGSAVRGMVHLSGCCEMVPGTTH